MENFFYLAELLFALSYTRDIGIAFSPENHQALLYFLILLTGLAAVILPGFLLLSLRILRPMLNEHYFSYFWKYISIIPMIYILIFHMAIYAEPSVFLPEQALQKLILEILWFIGSFLCIFLMLFILKQNEHTYQLKKKYQLLDTQIEMQKLQYQNMQKTIETYQRYKHDFRHHAVVINALLQQKNYHKLEEYICQTLPPQHYKDAPSLCENSTIDPILRHYYELANLYHIKTDFSVLLDANLPIPANDLCVIFGNLLENAMNACRQLSQEERFIHITCKPFNGILTLQIQNSYQGKILKNHNHFLSTKHSRKAIGISSVQQIVNKNHGVCNFRYTDHVFSVSILLNDVSNRNIPAETQKKQNPTSTI